MPEPLAHREVDHGGIKEEVANNVRHSQYHETREKNPSRPNRKKSVNRMRLSNHAKFSNEKLYWTAEETRNEQSCSFAAFKYCRSLT